MTTNFRARSPCKPREPGLYGRDGRERAESEPSGRGMDVRQLVERAGLENRCGPFGPSGFESPLSAELARFPGISWENGCFRAGAQTLVRRSARGSSGPVLWDVLPPAFGPTPGGNPLSDRPVADRSAIAPGPVRQLSDRLLARPGSGAGRSTSMILEGWRYPPRQCAIRSDGSGLRSGP